jgi:biotin carboxyl carrier protein
MTFDVTVNDRPWRVAIEPADAQGGAPGSVITIITIVTIRGRRRTYDASWIDAATLSLIPLEGPSRIREFGIEARGTGELRIEARGQTFHATVLSDGRSNQRDAHRVKQAAEPVQGRQNVVASMPGRIVRVLVTPGVPVTAGQPVVVVEAMKMENEMRAPKNGTVREVRVKEGAAIEAGAVLVVID